MKYFIVFAFIGCLALNIDGFTLSKDNDDHLDVEHESHNQKVVSGGENDKPAKVPSRRSNRDNSDERGDSRDSSSEAESHTPIESVAIGVNTGENTAGKHEGVEKLIHVVKEVIKKVNPEPLFRSKKFDFGYSNKQRDKSSVGIEVDTPTVLNWVKKVISSKKFKKATDEFARKAAVIFRALKDD